MFRLHTLKLNRHPLPCSELSEARAYFRDLAVSLSQEALGSPELNELADLVGYTTSGGKDKIRLVYGDVTIALMSFKVFEVVEPYQGIYCLYGVVPRIISSRMNEVVRPSDEWVRIAYHGNTGLLSDKIIRSDDYIKTLREIIPVAYDVATRKQGEVDRSRTINETLTMYLGEPTSGRVWSKRYGDFTLRASRRSLGPTTQEHVSIFVEGYLTDFTGTDFADRKMTLKIKVSLKDVSGLDTGLQDILNRLNLSNPDT